MSDGFDVRRPTAPSPEDPDGERRRTAGESTLNPSPDEGGGTGAKVGGVSTSIAPPYRRSLFRR